MDLFALSVDIQFYIDIFSLPSFQAGTVCIVFTSADYFLLIESAFHSTAADHSHLHASVTIGLPFHMPLF